MAIREILKMGNPVLLKEAKEVEKFDEFWGLSHEGTISSQQGSVSVMNTVKALLSTSNNDQDNASKNRNNDEVEAALKAITAACETGKGNLLELAVDAAQKRIEEAQTAMTQAESRKDYIENQFKINQRL